MIRYNLVKGTSRRRWAFIFSTAFLFAFLIWFLNHIVPFKNIWEPFYTEQDIGTFFCEKTIMENIVRQPINTFSNFIYWISAIIILRRGIKDLKRQNHYNIISANPFYSILLGVILLYIFCASVFFHSSLIHFAAQLDFSAVYSLTLYPLMYFAHRVWLLRIGVPSNQRHPKSRRTLIAAFTISYLLLTFFMPNSIKLYAELSMIIFLVILGIIVEHSADPGKTNHYYLLASSGCILLGVVSYAIDVKKLICYPGNPIQPHSLWHLFSGMAVFYFYMYIRSEKNKI